MMDVDIKGLIRKLNRFCTRSLEAGAGLAISRGHYEVTTEHMFLQLLEDPQGDVQQILHHFGINPAPLLGGLQRDLEGMRSGSSGKPVFSPLMLEWFQDAWLLSSVEYGERQIRSGVLLLALSLRPERYTGADLLQYLDGIKRDELRTDLYRITVGSRETEGPSQEPGAVPTGRPGVPAEETAIGRFMIDFTERARADQIDPVFGRDREIRQMIDILARRRKNNPIVVGEPGVGKTAVVEGLALRIAKGDVPDVLRNVRLLCLDLGLLQAGAGMRGEFENRLKGVISEVKASPVPIVTFIDEAHTIIGAGGTAGGSDAANLLKPALARGELRTIAATTWSEYKEYFEKDAALERRFQLVKLDEPSEDATVLMLRGLRQKYEDAHGIQILEEGIEAAVRLSSRYISGRQLPDKAVDLLDTAGARVKIGQATIPESIDDLDRKLQALERESDAVKREMATGGESPEERLKDLAAEIAKLQASREELVAQWDKEKEAVGRVKALRERLNGSEPGGNGGTPIESGADKQGEGASTTAESDSSEPLSPEERVKLREELGQAMTDLRELQGPVPLVPLDVDGRLVASVVSGWTGIPVGKMVGDEAASVLTFRDRLAERIKGQDHALDSVDQGIRAARAGLKNPRTPIGVFLFVGPSGVGKTETGLAVAELMFGGERFLTTINMSEFQEKHTVSRLIGSPPGYVGYGKGGVLTEAIRQRPYSVVLLDEVEKADPEVMNLFYQVFDKGMLADGEGRVIDFKNTVLFLTSNLASDVIMQLCSGPVLPTAEEVKSAIRPVISKHFKPAFLGRLEIVPFYPLASQYMKLIVQLKLGQIADRMLDSHRIRLEIDPKVEETIVNRCTDVESGARNIDHIIQQTLLPMMSTTLLEKMSEGPLPETARINVDQGESFVIEFGVAKMA
jgi:type VI secretion system protein VasG